MTKSFAELIAESKAKTNANKANVEQSEPERPAITKEQVDEGVAKTALQFINKAGFAKDVKPTKPAFSLAPKGTETARSKTKFQLGTKERSQSLQAAKPKANARDVLFGTGITKKLATSATKSREKADVVTIAKDIAADGLQLNKASTELPDQPPILSLDTPSDIVLDDSQQRALNGLETQMYGCLIGAAGTGKTTVTKELVKRIKE